MYKLTINDIKYGDKIVKPFEISDDIINSITLQSFKTLTKEQAITLNFVIKETLRRVRENNEECELALVYDLNTYYNQYNEWLFQVRGEDDSDQIVLDKNSDVLHMLEDFKREHIIVISHNHPNNRIVSLMDLRMLLDSENTKMIVAVTNSGRISYIVKENFDVEKYNIIRAEVVKDNENTDKKIINDKYLIDMLNRCEEFGVYFYKEA